MARPKREHDTDIGPGGIKCRCCGPGKGKARCEHRRRVRRRRKAADRQEIDEALAEVDPEGKYLP